MVRTLNLMTNPPNAPVQPTEPLDRQAALEILAAMAAEYQKVKAAFDDVRSGLVEAARDAKIVGVPPIEIQRITGWSKTTVHANTQMPTASGHPDPTVQPVTEAATK